MFSSLESLVIRDELHKAGYHGTVAIARPLLSSVKTDKLDKKKYGIQTIGRDQQLNEITQSSLMNPYSFNSPSQGEFLGDNPNKLPLTLSCLAPTLKYKGDSDYLNSHITEFSSAIQRLYIAELKLRINAKLYQSILSHHFHPTVQNLSPDGCTISHTHSQCYSKLILRKTQT